MPAIAIEMTDEDVIRRVAQMWAVACVVPGRRASNWKQTFCAQLRGRRAVELMNDLRPLMGKRRQRQIDAALAGYDPLPSDRRRLSLPSAAKLRRLHRVYSLRQIGVMLGCSYTTISNRMNAS
jgi:hypothetical protein